MNLTLKIVAVIIVGIIGIGLGTLIMFMIMK